MKSQRVPYFEFYPSDFMKGVRGLTAQEVGVYTMILCRIYEESGPVEYNILRLSTYCAMRESSFEKAMKKLIDLGKFTLSNGMIMNDRAGHEISSRSHKLKSNSLAGKKSAEKRQQNQYQSSTDVQRITNHTDTDTDTVKNNKKSHDKVEDLAMKIEEAAGGKIQPHSLLVLGPIYEMMTQGVELEMDIIPSIRSAASRMTKTVSLSYFLPVIRQAYEKRVQAGKGITPPKLLEETDEAWTRRLSFAREKKTWDTKSMGPAPGLDGCRVPGRLLRDGDGNGWKEYGNAA